MTTTRARPLLDLDLERLTRGQRPALVLQPPTNWEQRAACRWMVTGPETDLFYGADGERHTALREKQAKRICDRCPVRAPCLARALETREPYGVWGGLTAEERRDLLASHGTRLPRHPSSGARGGS